MTADLSTRLRIARAAVFAGACVALSATGHSLADGVGVGSGTWGLGFVLVFAIAVAAGSREWSQKAITLGLFAGQLGLHLLFSIDPGTSVAVPAMDMSGALPMSAHSMAAHAGWSMVAAHLVSGTVTGWWLRRAEVAAAAALRAAWVGLTFIPGPSAPRLVPVAAARTAPPGRAISVWLAQCSPRRGPPEMPIA